MSRNVDFKSFIFDSPLDFLLIGIINGNEQVLIHSRSLDLDLLGWYQNFIKENKRRFLRRNNSVFLPAQINNHFVEIKHEGGISQRDFTNEKRHYNVVLLWKGFGKNNSIANEEIKDELSKRLSDIMISLENEDRSLLEWNIAPVINLCQNFSEDNNRSKKTRLVLLGFYVIFMVVFLFIFAERLFLLF
tara:strand:- start:1102 stop:1668 length:567 start_codon:yes stop_codon:yes gene_type:complete